MKLRLQGEYSEPQFKQRAQSFREYSGIVYVLPLIQDFKLLAILVLWVRCKFEKFLIKDLALVVSFLNKSALYRC